MDESVPAGALDSLRTNPKYEFKIGTYNVFHAQPQASGAEEAAVRQAIATGIDKRRLVRVIKGLGEAATGGLFSPLSPYSSPISVTRMTRQKGSICWRRRASRRVSTSLLGARTSSPTASCSRSSSRISSGSGSRSTPRPRSATPGSQRSARTPGVVTENEWELPYLYGSYVMDGAVTQTALKASCCNFSGWVSPRFDKLASEAPWTANSKQIVALHKEMDDRIAIRDEALPVPLFSPKRAECISSRGRGYSIRSTPSWGVLFVANYCA